MATTLTSCYWMINSITFLFVKPPENNLEQILNNLALT